MKDKTPNSQRVLMVGLQQDCQNSFAFPLITSANEIQTYILHAEGLENKHKRKRINGVIHLKVFVSKRVVN